MAEDTLRQIQEATAETIRKSGSNFKRILEMDTTNTKTMQTVAEATEKVSESLNVLLDESLCVLPADAMPPLPAEGIVRDQSTIQKFLEAVASQRQFMPRSQAETNPNYYQPIPCAVVTFHDRILFLRRKKKGHPLHNSYAVWTGGHVVQSDDKGSNILVEALEREVSEEIFIRGEYTLDPEPVGLVRTSEDARASRHVGVVYRLELKTEDVALAMNQREFRETRGNSMSGRLVEVNRIPEFYDEMGNWSKFIVDEFWPEPTGTDQAAPLFGSPE